MKGVFKLEVVKVFWSGGKNSTTAVMKHLELGHKVKAVCYIPMLTKDVPLILRCHYDFILKTAKYFESLGVEVYFARDGLTYYDYVTHIALTGKNKGKMFGFPSVNRSQCGFKRDGKIRACSCVDVGYYDYEDIGIAFDEYARHNQLNDLKRSILCELGIFDIECIEFCKSKNLYSPHYSFEFKKKSKRDGCALCPHASALERYRYFQDYPEAVNIVIQLQTLVKIHRPEHAPLRGKIWFIN